MSNAKQFLGDDYEQGLKIFGGSAVTAFRNRCVLFRPAPTDASQDPGRQFISQKTIANATSEQFILFNQEVPEPEEHTGGDELEGQQWETEQDSIELDKKPLKAHRSISERDLIVAHYDTIAPLGTQCGWAIGDYFDKRMFRLAVLAARSTSLSKNGLVIHNGGNRVERVDTSLAAAYPVSSTGARRFRDDTDNLAQIQDEDDVPEGDRTLFITPYIRRVLGQDPGIFDQQYTIDQRNSMNTRAIGQISGYDVVVVNNRIPSTVVATGPTKYQGDFTVAGSSGQPAAVALCGATAQMAAIGALVAQGLTIKQDMSERKGDLMLIAKLFMGADVMHPWCAGVIEVDDS